jgi:hypothetical protein
VNKPSPFEKRQTLPSSEIRVRPFASFSSPRRRKPALLPQLKQRMILPLPGNSYPTVIDRVSKENN